MEKVKIVTINGDSHPIGVDWQNIDNNLISAFNGTTGVITIGGKQWILLPYSEQPPTKAKNTITFNPVSSAQSGTQVTLTATAKEGSVSFLAKDASGNTVLITNGKFTITSTTTVTATSQETSTYAADSVTKTITCVLPAMYAYYGSSVAEPSEVSTTNSKQLSSSTVIEIVTSSSDRKKCHWVAVKSNSGYRCTKIVDIDNDDITDKLNNKTIGEYTVYYYLSAAYISNTSKFTIAK